MRSFLLGAQVEGAFNIPFKVERGESMKTVKAIDSCTTANKIFDCFPPECSGKTLVLLSAVGGGIGVNNQMMVVYGQT